MNCVLKYSLRILPLLFGLVIFIFFGSYYKYHLHYHEQLQMFLFTSDYWATLMTNPGGLVDYLSTFFIQFYYFSWLGALIIASLLVLLQQQIFFLARNYRYNVVYLPLTFIPSFLFWGLLCDENFLLAGLLATILTLFVLQLYTLINKSAFRMVFGLIMIPFLYWFVGGTFWVFGVFCIALEWVYFKQFSKKQWVIYVVCLLLLVILPLFVTMHYLQYPISRLWWGICYYRYPVISPFSLVTIWLLTLVVPFIFRFLPFEMNKSKEFFIFLFQLILLALTGNILIKASTDWSKEQVMAYDYNVRTENWKQVIVMANRNDPKSPLTVTCLNLALGKNGNMGDCMFRYFQNGSEGLLPSFQRDFTMPFIAGEVYYHLGFLNTAMRCAFEAMEAIPDYKKSSRAIKRMAEVNLLNGEYKVASKYLHMLQYTLFYRSWASQTLTCINNDTRIDQNHEWALLRKERITDDFLFSEQEKDQMLGLLFTHCTGNKLAYEYLMAYTLLNKDLDHFVRYFPIGKPLGYKDIPAHYQEALIFAWANRSKNLDQSPWPISADVKKYFTNFAQLYASTPNADPQYFNSFSQTYWYYYNFRK